MTGLKAFIQRFPVLTYFVLTFLLSWGGVLIAVAPAGFHGSTQHTLFPIALVANEAGPLLAGILLTALIYGRPGLAALRAGLIKWRMAARWYAVAILTTPLLVAAILYALSSVSPVFLPAIVTAGNKAALLLLGIVVGLVEGGVFEETGWTGFATPELRRRYGVLATGLIVGGMWGIWHFLLTFWASGDASGAFSLANFLPPMLFYVAVLPVYRVLMVWVYEHTGSLLVGILMHASLTAFTVFILLPGAAGAALSTYYLILTAVLWVVVAALALGNGGQLARQPRHPEMRVASS
jgi:membrane protease YdiL (CAAX protease family)